MTTQREMSSSKQMQSDFRRFGHVVIRHGIQVATCVYFSLLFEQQVWANLSASRPRCIVPLGDAVWSPDRALLAHCNRAVSHATTTATPMRMVTMAIATLLLFCLMLYTASLLGCKAMPADGICDGSATICSRSLLGAGAAGGGAGGSSSSTVMTRSSLRGPSGHASGDARRPTKGFSHCSLPTAARIGCEDF